MTTFTMAAPGPIFPPAARPAGLRWRVRREQADPGSGTYEPVAAATTDGRWLARRAEDGTWAVGYRPTETAVKDRLPSLPACKAYVGSGKALADLELLRAHERGERETERGGECPEY